MTEYSVLKSKAEFIQHKIEVFNNKALKLGLQPIVFTINKVYQKLIDYAVIDRDGRELRRIPLMVDFADVVYDGEPPRLKDWEFVAVLEHTDEGTVIKRALGGPEIPDEYRNIDKKCDHCGLSRVRLSTFVVRNTKTGEFKQVGSSCVKDFVGWENRSFA